MSKSSGLQSAATLNRRTSAPPLPHLDRLVGQLCWSGGKTVSPDLLEDCRQEARLLLWRLGDKIKALPPDEREAYARVCVRHLVRRHLKKEHQHVTLAVSLDDLLATGEHHAELANDVADGGSDLLLQVNRSDLAEALAALDTRDYLLLDLFYGRDLTDAEIAGRLDVCCATAKMRRLRAIARLKKALCAS